MLKDKSMTYISLFSSAGVGCYGFQQEGFHCIATNEILEKRMLIQKFNNKCKYSSGYIVGDITNEKIKQKIYSEIDLWKMHGNDRVDVVIATPPCQGISVINHKKNTKDIKRNSLVVESIEMINKIQPRFFVIENVMAFQKTLCITPDNKTVQIGEYIKEILGKDYVISSKILNFMNYGANSSRTRTLIIGVDKKYKNNIAPYDLYPNYTKEKTLRDVIYNFPKLQWGEILSNDFYHAFRTYNPEMQKWIHNLNEGESAFDNKDPILRPHKLVNNKIIENVKKNRDKYTRQQWDRFIQCIHTRNDQLAAQNTIHPEQDRVFSIRELMEMMTIPKEFRWLDANLEELNSLNEHEKRKIYKINEMNIRQCIGEAVPTVIFQQVAASIKKAYIKKRCESAEINKIISKFCLSNRNNLCKFLKENPMDLDLASLMRITELCNALREKNAAFYTNKFIVNEIMENLPTFNKQEIRIIEPSVGAGSFIPFLLKKYENISKVIIDVIDIDENSIETLKILLKKLKVPSNFKINVICQDFLTFKAMHRYDLAIGNPPFTKIGKKAKENLQISQENYNKTTNNLAAMFLEKCIRNSDCVALVLNKTLLNNEEFKDTRTLLKGMRIDTIIDFGRYGFTGVSIETICIIVQPQKKPKKTIIYNLKYNARFIQEQDYITDNKFPNFIIYRDAQFDQTASQLNFGVFNVFRDRQITKSITSPIKKNSSLWVLKAKNINDNGLGVTHIKNYDAYISKEKASKLSAYRFVDNSDIYLTPNMTYNPRVIKNLSGVIPDGSVAVLIPKKQLCLSKQQMNYFSTDKYRRFYGIARNLSTQSINIDKTSVYFLGVLRETNE